jgi:DNA repair protein RecO (recombination protein O)
MRTYTARGITLLVRRFRGSERIATFYTREQGKVEAVASGVGKPGSKLAGALEPFTLSDLLLATGRNMDRLTQAQVVEAWHHIPQEVTAFGYGTWMAELTARATEPGAPHPELFESLERHLRALDQGGKGAMISAAYGFDLLDHLGLSPRLDCCARCGQANTGVGRYEAEAGGLVCAACQSSHHHLTLTPGHRALLHGLRRLAPERLQTLKPREAEMRQLLLLLRRHIAYHLGLTLKSDRFLSQLVGAEGSGE